MRIIIIVLLLTTGLVSAQDNNDIGPRAYELYVNPNVIFPFPDSEVTSIDGTVLEPSSNAYLQPKFVSNFGITTSLKANERTHGRVGIQFAKTGKRFENVPGEPGSGIRFSTVDFTYTNIDLPLEVVYSLGNSKMVNLYFSLGTGFRAAYVSKTKINVNQETDLGTTNDFEVALEVPRNIDFSSSPITLGLGINYKLSPRYSLVLEPNYSLAPKHIVNESYYSAFGLRLGIEFNSQKNSVRWWKKISGEAEESEPEAL